MIDQGLSAPSNLLLSVMVARSATASACGAFAVAFLVYSLVLGFSRALIGQPLQIGFASVTQEEFRHSAGHALGAARRAMRHWNAMKPNENNRDVLDRQSGSHPPPLSTAGNVADSVLQEHNFLATIRAGDQT